MKIKKHPKRASVAHPDIEAVIARINACPDARLAQCLHDEIPPNTPWRFPRGDLHCWVTVLDRFDGLLATLCAAYQVDSPDATGVQSRPFSGEDQRLILEILRFERILLDNSTSRKIYASYDRLQSLLFTQDLHVLHATVLLILRPSQQYGSHTPFELSNNKVVRQRLLKIVMAGGGWGKLKESGYDMVKLAKMSEEDAASETTNVQQPPPLPLPREYELDLPAGFYDLSAQFYRPSTADHTHGYPHPDHPGTSTPVSTELERPTQELRIQPSPLGRVAGAGAAERAMGEDEDTWETPSRPAAVRRPSGNETPAPLVRFATAPQQQQQQHETGSSSVTAFSRAYTNGDGLTVLYVPSASIVPLVKSGAKDAVGVLRDLLESHPELRGVPEEEEKKQGDEAQKTPTTTTNKYTAINDAMREEQFELLCRLRIMLMMDVHDGRMDPRVKADVTLMLEIRLAALATYLYLTPEDKAQTELFLYEPALVGQLAELVNPASRISDVVAAPAFMALDACAHYRYKCTEVVSALGANVAHGTLMNCYREVIRRLATDEGAPHELVDSVLSFVAFLATSSGYGNMLVGAGIIPVIIELVKVEHPARGGYVARAMGLIDNMMYTSNNAFNIFCNASGLETLNHRITVEVDRLIGGEYAESNATESDLLRRTTPLKLMLRSVHRLMQASGTVDALRNLIDSDLPKSLLKIFHHVDKMGASVFALAIHVTAAFVHNEPTSLSIIQEMKLPDALYDALERNRQPSFEILSAVPNAVGAFCLNAAGMDLVVQRREVLGRLVNNCADPAYRDILRERDNATFLGTSLDELARHHPPLKPILLESLATLLKDLVQQGQTAAVFNQWEPAKYRLMTVEDVAKSQEEDAKKQAESKDDVKEDAPVVAMSEPDEPRPEADSSTSLTFGTGADQKSSKKDDNQIEITIDIVAQLMQGLFHNPQLGKDFLAQDGLKLVLDIYGSPSLRNSFATSPTAERLHIVLRHLAEASLSKVLNGLVESVRGVMDTCRGLWDSGMQDSYLSPMIPALCESFSFFSFCAY